MHQSARLLMFLLLCLVSTNFLPSVTFDFLRVVSCSLPTKWPRIYCLFLLWKLQYQQNTWKHMKQLPPLYLLYLILSRQTCTHRENAIQRLELCCQNSRNYSKWGLRSREEPSLVFSEGTSPCWHLAFGFTLWACLMAQMVKNLPAMQ